MPWRRSAREGVVTIEEGKSLKTEMTLVEGMALIKHLSPYFMTNPGTMERSWKMR